MPAASSGPVEAAARGGLPWDKGTPTLVRMRARVSGKHAAHSLVYAGMYALCTHYAYGQPCTRTDARVRTPVRTCARAHAPTRTPTRGLTRSALGVARTCLLECGTMLRPSPRHALRRARAGRWGSAPACGCDPSAAAGSADEVSERRGGWASAVRGTYTHAPFVRRPPDRAGDGGRKRSDGTLRDAQPGGGAPSRQCPKPSLGRLPLLPHLLLCEPGCSG